MVRRRADCRGSIEPLKSKGASTATTPLSGAALQGQKPSPSLGEHCPGGPSWPPSAAGLTGPGGLHMKE